MYIWYAMDLMNYSHSTSLNINSIQAYFQKLWQPTEIYAFDISVSRFLGGTISACWAAICKVMIIDIKPAQAKVRFAKQVLKYQIMLKFVSYFWNGLANGQMAHSLHSTFILPCTRNNKNLETAIQLQFNYYINLTILTRR